jgi:hypothetical protein
LCFLQLDFTQSVTYNDTYKNYKLHYRGIGMTSTEKRKLIKQASKLYTLGITVERRREKVRRLVEKKIPYDSPEMEKALSEFHTADMEWKRLEQEHLNYRAQFGIPKDALIK